MTETGTGLSRGDDEFLAAARTAGFLEAGDVPDVLESRRRAEQALGRPVPVVHILYGQRWLSEAQVEQLRAATRRKILLCPNCWARVNVFETAPGEQFSCRGCGHLVGVPFDPHAELLSSGPCAVSALHPDPAPVRRETLRLRGLEVVEELGFGAMSVVYRALALPHRTSVAVKILHQDLVKDPQAVRRFFREARIAARLRHENIAAFLHAGFTGGFYYIILEWVPGTDLRRNIESTGAVPARRALEIARDVARGLGAVHEQGIVHRDVKPSNVLLPGVGPARLTDFGLSAGREASIALTRTGEILGTLNYMAPEQFQDPRSAGPRSDVYSLGATLYHTLSGKAPFADAPWTTIADSLIEGTVPVLALPENLPSALAGLVRTLMAQKPDQRFADGREAASAIEQLLSVT